MSVTTIDYLPFDYTTYIQQILPALHGATEGDEVSLHTLLQSLHRISFGPRSLLSLPLSAKATEQLLEGIPFNGLIRLEGLLDVATLRHVRSGEPLNPWHHLAKVIPFLKGRSLNNLGYYGEMLHFHLFYTLCTEPPVSWTGEDPVLPHDNPVFDWKEYTSRDEEMCALWGMFAQTAPEALTQYLQMQSNTPRALALGYLCRENITGFLTPQELRFLLAHVRIHEKPWLESMLFDCLYAGAEQGWKIDPNLPTKDRDLFITSMENDTISWKDKIISWIRQDYEERHADFQTVIDYWLSVYPKEMQEFQERRERRYWDLWQAEAEILQRMRLAVAHGWGMIQTCYQ